MPRLLVEKGADKGKVFYVPPHGAMYVGRDPTVAIHAKDSVAVPEANPDRGGRRQSDRIRIADILISRVHFCVEGDGSGYQLRDEESLNGTFVNGRKVVKTKLSVGDAIRAGDTLFSFIGDDVVADPLVGQKLSGYRIIQRVGRGGMGTVYKAEQIDLQRIVALKVISAEYAKTSSFLELFLKEARAAARLNHPNVVQIYDVKKFEDIYFFSMEFLPGGSVQDRLAQSRTIPVPEALEMVLDAARGLEYAHTKGIIHRDVKPDNLMISETRIVKIGDLGLAQNLADKDRVDSSLILGTPHYIAPELLFGRALTFASDVYALGSALYRMLTGVTPYFATTVNELIQKKMNTDPPPPETHNPDIPPVVSALVRKMMSREPEQRYPGMGEVIAEVKRIQAESVPAAIGEVPKRSFQRWWWVVGAAAAVLIGLTIWLVSKRGSEQKPAITPSPVPAPPVTPDPEAAKKKREEEARQAMAEAERFEKKNMVMANAASIREAAAKYAAAAEKFPGTSGAAQAVKRKDFLLQCAEARDQFNDADFDDDRSYQKLIGLFLTARSPDMIDVDNNPAKINELIDPVVRIYQGVYDRYRQTPAGVEARQRADHIRKWKKAVADERKKYREAVARSEEAVRHQEYWTAWQVLREYAEESSRSRTVTGGFSPKRYTDVLYDDLVPPLKEGIEKEAAKAYVAVKEKADLLGKAKKYREATDCFRIVHEIFRMPDLVQRANEEQQFYLQKIKAEEEAHRAEMLSADRERFDRLAPEAYARSHEFEFKEAQSCLEREKAQFQTSDYRQIVEKRIGQLRMAAHAKEGVIKKIMAAIAASAPGRILKKKIGAKEVRIFLQKADDRGYEYTAEGMSEAGRIGESWKNMGPHEYYEFVKGWVGDTERDEFLALCMEIGLYEQAREVLNRLSRQPSRPPQAFLAEYTGYLNQGTYPESPEVEAQKRLERLQRFVQEKPMDEGKIRRELEGYKARYAETTFFKRTLDLLGKVEEKLQRKK